MTSVEYENIKMKATKRFKEYSKMLGSYNPPISRKEDDFLYWVAVSAYEEGQKNVN